MTAIDAAFLSAQHIVVKGDLVSAQRVVDKVGEHMREGGARSESIRAGDDDQQRWSSIRLYSDSTRHERLAMPVMKAAGLAMRLDPKSGQLSFSKPGARHTFSIASPAGVNDKNARMPDAKPPPSLKIIPNGYRFEWAGVQPSNGKMSTTVLHNSYTRQAGKTGGMILLCTNLSAPHGQGVEDEMCEGAVLMRIRDNKDSSERDEDKNWRK